MFRTLVLLVIVTALGGCIGYHRTSETVGYAPDQALLQGLDGGTLTIDTLNERLGPPSSIGHPSADTQLWVYDARASRSHRAQLLPLVAFQWQSARQVRHVFEVRDGEVTRHWQENF